MTEIMLANPSGRSVRVKVAYMSAVSRSLDSQLENIPAHRGTAFRLEVSRPRHS